MNIISHIYSYKWLNHVRVRALSIDDLNSSILFCFGLNAIEAVLADVGRAFEAGMICTIRYDAYDFCAPLKANE